MAVVDESGLYLPVGASGGQLLLNRDASDAAQQDVVAPVGELLVAADDAHPAERQNRRSSLVLALPARRELRDRHRALVLQHVLEHRAVAGLEDMKWNDLVGQEHGPRKRKDRQRVQMRANPLHVRRVFHKRHPRPSFTCRSPDGRVQRPPLVAFATGRRPEIRNTRPRRAGYGQAQAHARELLHHRRKAVRDCARSPRGSS